MFKSKDLCPTVLCATSIHQTGLPKDSVLKQMGNIWGANRDHDTSVGPGANGDGERVSFTLTSRSRKRHSEDAGDEEVEELSPRRLVHQHPLQLIDLTL